MKSDFVTRLSPPPRRVPLSLRCALLANLPVLIGGVILAVGLLLTIIFLSAGNLFGDLRLRLGSGEAAGALLGVERTNFREGGGDSDSRSSPAQQRRIDEHHRIYRLSYSFELPDGIQVRGESYVKGMRSVRRMEQEAGDDRQVAIQYVPSAPQTSRIQGTRTSPYGPAILLSLIFPAMGLGVVAAGVVSAERKVRLLRRGEAAPATITACRAVPQGASGKPHSAPTKWMPFEQFRKEMQRTVADHIEEGTGTRTSGFSVMGIGTSKTEEISGTEFKRWFQSHLTLFRRALFGLFGFWALIFAFILWAIFQAEMDAFERILFLGVFLLMGLFFIGFGWFVLRFTRRAQGVVTGGVKMEDLRVRVECRFEFTTRAGRKVRTEDRVIFDSSRLGDEPHEPVLYDPADPGQALLLDGLPVPVQVGPLGDLEATGVTWRALGAAGVGALVLAAAVGGWIATG